MTWCWRHSSDIDGKLDEMGKPFVFNHEGQEITQPQDGAEVLDGWWSIMEF